MSTANDDGLPPRPVPPRPDECCGGGCPRCVYDLYDEAVAEWERLVAEREKALSSVAKGDDA
jgi:oxidoreductase family protein